MTDNTTKDTPEQQAALLLAYSKEIAPKIQAVLYQKELLKDFKESDETALGFAEDVGAAQDALKAYIEGNDDAKAILTQIKELETDLKQAIRAAARGTDYKAAVLKAFFTARQKEDAVKKTITKGDLFDELEKALT